MNGFITNDNLNHVQCLPYYLFASLPSAMGVLLKGYFHHSPPVLGWVKQYSMTEDFPRPLSKKLSLIWGTFLSP